MKIQIGTQLKFRQNGQRCSVIRFNLNCFWVDLAGLRETKFFRANIHVLFEPACKPKTIPAVEGAPTQSQAALYS